MERSKDLSGEWLPIACDDHFDRSLSQTEEVLRRDTQLNWRHEGEGVLLKDSAFNAGGAATYASDERGPASCPTFDPADPSGRD